MICQVRLAGVHCVGHTVLYTDGCPGFVHHTVLSISRNNQASDCWDETAQSLYQKLLGLHLIDQACKNMEEGHKNLEASASVTVFQEARLAIKICRDNVGNREKVLYIS